MGSLCARGAFCTPTGYSYSSKAPLRRASFPTSSRFIGCSLNRQSEGKLRVLTSFLKFLICFAHVLICTNSLSLQKRLFLRYVAAGPLKAVLTAGLRHCSELRAAAFIQLHGLVSMSSRQGRPCRATAGAGSRVEQRLGRKVEGALLEVGGSAFLSTGCSVGSQAHGTVPGGLEFPWFLKGLVCRQPLFSFMDCT